MSRKLHRWLALVTAVPFTVIVLTGVLLQVKRWFPTIQPTSQRSPAGPLAQMPSPLGWDALLAALKGAPDAGIRDWKDVKVLDVRPALGVARARTKAGYEVQVDLASGAILSSAPRYASLLIEIHEGAYFGTLVRNAVFLPTAILMVVVTLTGLWLLKKHYIRKRFP